MKGTKVQQEAQARISSDKYLGLSMSSLGTPTYKYNFLISGNLFVSEVPDITAFSVERFGLFGDRYICYIGLSLFLHTFAAVVISERLVMS
jgi:hypothetical protein